MVYKFRIISDEVDDFLREIKIDSVASFYDLHEAILKCTKLQERPDDFLFLSAMMTGKKEIEITLEDMGTGSSEEDTFVMKDTRLSELLEDEKQKLIYVFDPLTERVFLYRTVGNHHRQGLGTCSFVRARKEIHPNKP